MTACILSFMSSNVIHFRKEMEKSSVMKFFLQERKDYRIRSHLSNRQHHKLWDAPWHPLDISNSWFVYSFNFVF
jgi:hypothetical protein